MLGFPIFDPIASLLICLLLAKTAFSIAREAAGQLIDKAADEETVARIAQEVCPVSYTHLTFLGTFC